MSDYNDFEDLLQSKISGKILLQYTVRNMSASRVSSGESSDDRAVYLSAKIHISCGGDK